MSIFNPTQMEAEQALVGCCLSGGREISLEVVKSAPLDAFLHEDFRDSWRVINDLAVNGDEINEVTFGMKFSNDFGPGVPMMVQESLGKIPSASNWPYYHDVLMEAFRRRCVAEAGSEMAIATVTGPTPEAIIMAAEAKLSKSQPIRRRFMTPAESSMAMMKDLEDRTERRMSGEHSGILTGYTDLDKMTDGLQPGDQFVIGARPSQGKTALGLNIIEHVALRLCHPCLVFSIEMGMEAIMRRMAASYGRILLANLKSGNLSAADVAKANSVRSAIAKSSLQIIDCVAGITIEELVLTARSQIRLNGIKVVLIDYLQKIRPSSRQEKRTYEIGEVSERLKALASTSKIALISLAQLNREPDRDKGRTPRISDLADSGQIERDADGIALLHRLRTEEDPQGMCAELHLAKQRDGETGTVHLTFLPEYTRFENAARIASEDAQPRLAYQDQ